MSKLIKKISLFVISAILSMQCIACGGGSTSVDNTKEDTTTLNITIIERGYGTAFLDSLEREFEKRNPGIEVEVTKTALANVLTNSFDSGSQYNDCDLYFNVGVTSYGEYHKYYKFFNDSESAFYCYDDILDSTIPGESVTVREKLQAQVLESTLVDVDGQQKSFFLPWASAIQGMAVNKTVLESIYGANVGSVKMNTTDEFYNLCVDIRDKGYTALIYPGQLNYWNSLYNVWWAQYEGTEAHKMFQYAKGYDEISGEYIYTSNIFKQQGRLESLKVMEKLLYQGSNLHKDNVNDYNKNNFTTLQTQYLYGSQAGANDAKYVFNPNGDWLMQESAINSQCDSIDMIKVPIISSITDKLAVIKTDEHLSLVVDYVDGTITKDALLSNQAFAAFDSTKLESDIAIVREARSLVYSQGYSHLMYSPYYTNAKELVKKFILFMMSNDGLKIYAESGNGGFIPANIQLDESKLAPFAKSIYSFVNNGTFIDDCKKTILFAGNYIQDGKVNSGNYEALLGAKTSSAYYKTAQQIFEGEWYTDDQFNLALQNSGLLK